MADEEDRWVNAAALIYERIAPSYVLASAHADRLTLRNLHKEGATLDQLEEAFMQSFHRSDVEKRKAFRYAVGIVRDQIRWRE